MSTYLDIGPQKGTIWIINDVERTKAKQLAMLAIDVRFAERWVKTMTEIVALELSDKECTVRRMRALALWTKDRKREAHNLHYAYDPRRRPERLVAAEIKAQLAKLQKRVDEHDVGGTDVPPTEPGVPVKTPRPVRPTKPVTRSLDGVPVDLAAMITMHTGIRDLTHATDGEILNAYAAADVSEKHALEYLAYLSGELDWTAAK